MPPVQGMRGQDGHRPGHEAGHPAPGCWSKAGLLAAASLLCACGHPLDGPLDLFHGLEGGEIAAARPPPPGAGMPYPELGTVPAKPVVADPSYRLALSTQLLGERDRTERLASDSPIPVIPPLPGPQVPATAPPGAGSPANAMLDTADAPPSPRPASMAALPPSVPPPATPSVPLSATPLTQAGVPMDMSVAPQMPDQPPPPATFEGVPAEPAPTPTHLPARLSATPLGTTVYFATASAALPPSQTQTLKTFSASRGSHAVEILGLGEAASDSPDGQATAVALGLSRARAVADALAALHVPPASIRVGADAFGRGAVLHLLP